MSESEELAEAVVDEVEEGVADDVAVALAVGVFDAVLDVVTLPVAVTEGVTGGVPYGDGELLGEPSKDSVVVGVLDCERVADTCCSLLEGVSDSDDVTLGAPETIDMPPLTEGV